MIKKLTPILLVLILLFGVFVQPGFSQSSKESNIDQAEILKKLDEILLSQKEILEQMEQLKQELAIIKVRASR